MGSQPHVSVHVVVTQFTNLKPGFPLPQLANLANSNWDFLIEHLTQGTVTSETLKARAPLNKLVHKVPHCSAFFPNLR